MKAVSVLITIAVCSLLLASVCAGDTEVIKGTVVKSPAGAASVDVRVDGKVISVKRGQNTAIIRGPAGGQAKAAMLREFAVGDAIVVTITNGETVSMKATYAAPKHTSTPKINSITFSAPVPLKAGDIITVDLAGTSGAKAAFAVKNLISTVYLKEVSPGAYHGSVKVPDGKTVRNAPLVGYMGMGKVHAPPVQAARLVTVGDPERLTPTIPPLGVAKPGPAPLPEPAKLPPPAPEPAPKKPSPPPPAPAPAPTPPPAPQTPEASAVPPSGEGKIVLTSPTDGATVRRAIVVKGKADPGSAVKVTITYSNQLNGLLKLAGEVVSQNLSAGSNGEFRMGPIALDGPLATPDLKFTIKAYYPDRADHGTAQVCVIGKRD